jgi:hypothetical protein
MLKYSKNLTKKEVLLLFKYAHDEVLKELRGDSIAKRELWNNYIDSLYKDGLITTYQYKNWTNPF